MLARALVLLNAANTSLPDLDMAAHQSVEVTGEGPDWVSAKNACATLESVLNAQKNGPYPANAR